jgi:hypothetical protein
MCEKYIGNLPKDKELFAFPSRFFHAEQLIPSANSTARRGRQTRQDWKSGLRWGKSGFFSIFCLLSASGSTILPVRRFS